MFTAEDEARYQAALVRFYNGSKILGAGILVAEQYVLTCAHVLTRTTTAPDAVTLDFPFNATEQKLTGTVEYWNPERDLAGVRLLDAAPADTTPLPLQPSSNYVNGRFRVYGFPEKHPVGGWALGRVIGGATEDLVQIQGDTDQWHTLD
ncbi:MAG: trypsin-like peptidase domain-containing protein, partial [Leptolyngbya sp. SIO1D8]|nr:trypsin-like peptidase domain-containing protein [Leptolyngbya sp. SIO1D8]